VDAEEFRVAAVVDRVNTTATIWLGSTLECAQCHNHKYDPFTQEEYYRLFAFFNNDKPDIEADQFNLKLGNLGPMVKAPSRENREATSMVMEALPEPRKTHILLRGNFLAPDRVVTPGTPAALHPFPPPAPMNRKGLAEWLVSKENPLAARVTVNRIWEQYFGRGIVETLEDFGARGERPTHPELLDWLAVEFMESGWNLKHLHRLILNSATYRQTSRVTPALLERDPYNRLLARGPRFRVDAETVRDIALSASGLLNPAIGGPSVFPPQPEGIDRHSFGFYDLKARWVNAKEEDRYRRGLYTFWRRTAPYPAFLTFDAPRRDVCTVRRSRTNTPLQALVTLNDPVFAEASEALARRMVREGGTEEAVQITRGFRLALARKPSPAESERLRRLLEEVRPRGAEKAWMLVANVILNIDETITKD
jgi:hypothetical protein